MQPKRVSALLAHDWTPFLWCKYRYRLRLQNLRELDGEIMEEEFLGWKVGILSPAPPAVSRNLVLCDSPVGSPVVNVLITIQPSRIAALGILRFSHDCLPSLTLAVC